nr:type II secretion system protein GspM [uncultured Sphingomonas sp.]
MTALLTAPDWFLARSKREQWLLALMLAIAVPLIAWIAVYRPVMGALETAKDRHVMAVRNHGLVLARIAQIEGASRPSASAPSGEGATLALQVTAAAAQTGVTLGSNEPRGADSAVVTLAPAPPTAALRWLRQLEGSGAIVRELTITPQDDSNVVVAATLTRRSAR